MTLWFALIGCQPVGPHLDSTPERDAEVTPWTPDGRQPSPFGDAGSAREDEPADEPTPNDTAIPDEDTGVDDNPEETLPDKIRGPFGFFASGDCVDPPEPNRTPTWTASWAPPLSTPPAEPGGTDGDPWRDDLERAASWDPTRNDGPPPNNVPRPANGGYGVVVRSSAIDAGFTFEDPVGLIVESDRIVVIGPATWCPPTFHCGSFGCEDANPMEWSGEYDAGSQRWDLDLNWTPGHVHARGQLKYTDWNTSRQDPVRTARWEIEILRGPWADGQPDGL
jgi:hypothetical protein